jgi:hypothetical protein
MNPRRGVAIVLLLFALVACSSDESPADPAPAADRLPTGKSDLAVEAGTYLSPEGFTPELTLDVPAGWTSIHRGADAFDLGKPDPARDAPLVAVVVMRPPQASAADAIAAVEEAAGGAGQQVHETAGDLELDGIDVVGGHGQVVASADGGVALDAAPGQQLRVLAGDTDDGPVVVAVLVPDADQFDGAWREAGVLLDGIGLG